jgi:REP element-mobilizing transposase RayT
MIASQCLQVCTRSIIACLKSAIKVPSPQHLLSVWKDGPLFCIVGVFVESLTEVAQKQGFCAVYCFMPDHVHLVLFGNTHAANSLRAVELFKQMTGYWLKRNYPRIKWQKGFRDRILRESEIAAVVRYALNNPVRRGLVTQWREYPFTGAIGLDLEQLVADLATDES